jgi:antirestriction protein
MSLLLWLGIIIFSVGLWWFGFIATKQMRLDKNKDRTVMWEKVAAAQKKRREEEARSAEISAEISDETSVESAVEEQAKQTTKTQD